MDSFLQNDNETVVLTEKGYFSEPPQDPSYYFCFPYLHNSEVFRPPDWVRETVWYQIFPERFANGDFFIEPKGYNTLGVAKIPLPATFLAVISQESINTLII